VDDRYGSFAGISVTFLFLFSICLQVSPFLFLFLSRSLSLIRHISLSQLKSSLDWSPRFLVVASSDRHSIWHASIDLWTGESFLINSEDPAKVRGDTSRAIDRGNL
jgi:hypothetical protein